MSSAKISMPGINRFQLQLEKLEPLLAAASQSNDPAIVFYKSAARQYLFYLEALARIYKNMHNKKRFERLRLSFKSLEDQLGKVDYFDAYIKEFSLQENFPEIILNNLKQHYTNELKVLDALLKNDGWINGDNTMLKTIHEELESAEWENDLEDRNGIAEVLIEEIEEIEEDYASGKLNFQDLEHGVHEFRRQLRWVSIYAQALNGIIQLKEADVNPQSLQTYLTKEVVESPFNKMPEAKAGVAPIYIDAPPFYALSWLIAESGRLKDEGLRIVCVETAIRETAFVKEEEIYSLTKSLAIKSTQSPKKIKETMKLLADKFMNIEKVLEQIKENIGKSKRL